MSIKRSFNTILLILFGIMLVTLSTYAAESREITEEGVFLNGEFIIDRDTYLKAIAEKDLQLYTAHSLDHEEAMVKAFMENFPAIKVEITRAGGATLHEKMLTEEAAGVLIAYIVINSATNYLQEF